jgi:hypothetical protein
MKKLYFLLTALFLFSCQNEENTVNQNNDAALTKNSALASLVLRVSQNPTHWDNILDNSDCYSIKLPVTITLNGQNMSIWNETDLESVQQNMDSSWSDDDIVHFQFPITIIFKNFQQQSVANQWQLDAVDCQADFFNEIRCLDFIYPISINTYDINNQVANTVNIDNDEELYNFIHQLTTSEIFTVVYPVTMTLSGGGEVSVNSNNELEDAIENTLADCDTGSGPTPTELEDIVGSGTWYISYCEGDSSGPGPGSEDYYDGYVFTFNNNGSVTCVKNNFAYDGTWSIYQDGSHQMMDLYFPNQWLQAICNDQWRVIEYNTTNFRLKNDQSGGWNGVNEYVYFTKN